MTNETEMWVIGGTYPRNNRPPQNKQQQMEELTQQIIDNLTIYKVYNPRRAKEKAKELLALIKR